MNNLLNMVYQNAPDLPHEIFRLTNAGADPNVITQYGESPLRIALRNGRLDAIRVLLDAGADERQLGWSELHRLVAFGTIGQIKAQLQQHGGRDERDYWEHTPFLLAVSLGDQAKAAFLLAMGCQIEERGRCAKSALQYAAQQGNLNMLAWLLAAGHEIDAVDDFGGTALMEATECDQAAAVRFLLAQGANWRRENHIPQRAIHYARSKAVIEALHKTGESLSVLDGEQLGIFLSLERAAELQARKVEFQQAATREFGVSNAELTNHPFWLEMIRTGVNAWHARNHYEMRDFPKPVWCFDRFGRTVNRLPDGRVVVIAGEHEDYYDPDFCIYNDVVVFHPSSKIEIYSYPEGVFPPTDFHTATLVDDALYLIGNLGYANACQPVQTPVYRLDCKTMRIEQVKTKGDGPGWIYRHQAELKAGVILVTSGKQIINVQGAREYVDNDATWALDLRTLSWQKLADY
ncbi:ankyrin repeat domain-containing protein [Chitinibacter sp. S2-10]|uniref:ankyrin repeat domain-containing protein n=1 Tax=Chitinibacter sp. S2-10 TaxID=3373597 RepID=UPI003977B757